jgi:predicted RNase H-like HicB family nuclease
VRHFSLNTLSAIEPITLQLDNRNQMKNYTAVVERCPETGLYVGYVPGFAGAHSQGATLDELQSNLREVIEMLLEDGEPEFDAQFVGTQTITVE